VTAAHHAPTNAAARAVRRLVVGGVAALLLGPLLGAAIALQPTPAAPTAPAAAAIATPLTASAPRASGLSSVAPVDATARLGQQLGQQVAQQFSWDRAARELQVGCPGPDRLCDLGGDARDCAQDPIDCGKETAGHVKDGVESGLDGLGGLAEDLPGLPSLDDLPSLPGAIGCGVLDALCGGIGGLPGLGGIPGIPGVPGLPRITDLGDHIPGLGGIPDPFEALGDIIAKAAADAWTAAMLSLWSAGLFILRMVLTFSELFLTPDLRVDGPGKDVYAYTLWGALALVVIMAIVQLGVAAFKREGKGLARALLGSGQFVVVCAVWFGYCATIVAACGAITRALMKALLGVDTWPKWDPLGGLDTQDVADGTVATVLGLLGLVLWLAALGHLLIYLARAASLLVLVATGPLAAAGLVADAGRAWFWKSLRWFHAAAFTPVLMVLVLGIGMQMAGGVAAHLADSTQKTIGTALPAVMLICISAVAPLALFKLLAFVDPGTPSGASFRQGLAIQGGVQGLLGGVGGGGGSSAASQSDTNGRSTGEQGAESATGDRFGKSTQGLLGGLGPAGQALAPGLGWVQSAGAKGTSLMSDESNQAGVGHHTFGPDFSNARSSPGRSSSGQNGGGNQGGGIQGGGHPGQPDQNDYDGGDDPNTVTPGIPSMPPTPQTTVPTSAPIGGQGPRQSPEDGQGGAGKGAGAGPKPPAGAGGGAGGGTGAGAGAAGGGAAGAAVPPVA